MRVPPRPRKRVGGYSLRYGEEPDSLGEPWSRVTSSLN